MKYLVRVREHSSLGQEVAILGLIHVFGASRRDARAAMATGMLEAETPLTVDGVQELENAGVFVKAIGKEFARGCLDNVDEFGGSVIVMDHVYKRLKESADRLMDLEEECVRLLQSNAEIHALLMPQEALIARLTGREK